MKNSSIEWTHHTFNPWQGCTKVSAGCAHCYAETLSNRWGKDLWGPGRERQRTSAAYWKQPLRWNKEAAMAGERHRVFCASMADVFDEAVPNEWRMELWELIAKTENLDWLLLTKRPKNALGMLHHFWDNVWVGTSVEDQATANERIPILLQIPVRVLFLSCEPLLGPLDLFPVKVDWVIVGGESGPKHRPMRTIWAAAIIQQCTFAHVPVFTKPLGGSPDKRGDINEFPEYLRIREFPTAKATT